MIWHMTWRLGQADLNYKIINLPNIKTYKYTHLTKCLQSAFYFHNYSVKPSIKFLFTKYRVNKFINQWQTHRFTRTSIIFYSNLWLLEPSIPQVIKKHYMICDRILDPNVSENAESGPSLSSDRSGGAEPGQARPGMVTGAGARDRGQWIVDWWRADTQESLGPFSSNNTSIACPHGQWSLLDIVVM